MILDLPDVRDTVCGKELLAEGREEGSIEMVIKVAEKVLKKKLPKAVKADISKLKQDQLDVLFDALFDEIESIDQLKDYLANR